MTTQKTITINELGDPIGARPTTSYDAMLVAKRDLTDGREAMPVWLYDTPTHVHIVVWVPSPASVGPRGEMLFVKHVARFNAARETERLLKQMEA